MELRPEVMPPALDDAEVARLAELAAYLDGAPPERSADALAEFNRLAGTDLPWQEFQSSHGAEDHVDGSAGSSIADASNRPPA